MVTGGCFRASIQTPASRSQLEISFRSSPPPPFLQHKKKSGKT
jgi:hypothetical protein